tara:strand:- start:119 stop:835 length:717 start_codon:yes stop_codon:yes gene_type:complete
MLTDSGAIAKALARGQLARLVVCQGARLSREQRELVAAAKAQGVRVKTVVAVAFQREYGTYALAGLSSRAQTVALAQVVAGLHAQSKLLILDHIQDPHNMGALIRSAVSFGFEAVIYAKDRQCPVTDTVVSASAEAVQHIQMCQVSNIAQALQTLRKHQVWVYGTTVDAPESLTQWQPHTPCGLVMGHEHAGIGPRVQKVLDGCVRIDMPGVTGSLNVSTAGAIAMHWVWAHASGKLG